MMADLLLTFYGDDFTGSTDVTEALTWNGVPTVLFLEPPNQALIAAEFPYARAVGVAGVSRSMTPAEMDVALPPVFEQLAGLHAPLFHYKVCSTFDSAPHVGSIGHAIDLAWPIFAPRRPVPLVVGAPILKRYVAFGNLFATANDITWRIDRHPTMSRHPVTPMQEADLRLHLAGQTTRTTGLIDWLALQDEARLSESWQAVEAAGSEMVLFDTLSDADLASIGRLIWESTLSRSDDQSALVVGSSGVEYALAAEWQRLGMARQIMQPVQPGPVGQLIIVSGSAAPATAAQIEAAEAMGFALRRIDAPGLVDPDTRDAVFEQTVRDALAALAAGRSLILYSARGPDDPALQATRERMQQAGLSAASVSPILGQQQGLLLRRLLNETGLRRAVITGGDTCGHAARQLGIFALETILPVAPGAPLCRARSRDAGLDFLEISLKAGQVGKPDYFASILRGAA